MSKFYVCRRCGNLVGAIHESGVPMMCCGQKMEMLEANSVDASGEKHVPVVSAADGVVTVTVGSAAHPMTEEHLIEWVYIQTESGGQRKSLKAGDAPEVKFWLGDDKVVAVFAYCNLHGLWKTDV